MTRKDIATQLADQLEAQGMTPSLATHTVNATIDIMTEALKKGDTIYLRGLATIDTEERKARIGHDFKTGKTITVPARKVITIKGSKTLLKELNSK